MRKEIRTRQQVKIDGQNEYDEIIKKGPTPKATEIFRRPPYQVERSKYGTTNT